MEDRAMKGLLAVLTILVWVAMVGGVACLLWGPDAIAWFIQQMLKFAVFGVFAFIVTCCALGAMDSIDRL